MPFDYVSLTFSQPAPRKRRIWTSSAYNISFKHSNRAAPKTIMLRDSQSMKPQYNSCYYSSCRNLTLCKSNMHEDLQDVGLWGTLSADWTQNQKESKPPESHTALIQRRAGVSWILSVIGCTGCMGIAASPRAVQSNILMSSCLPPFATEALSYRVQSCLRLRDQIAASSSMHGQLQERGETP